MDILLWSEDTQICNNHGQMVEGFQNVIFYSVT